MRTKLFHLGLLAGVLLASSSQANAVAYTFIELKPSEGGGFQARAINNAGQVAGSYSNAGPMHAALWNGATMIDLSMPGEAYSYAYAINDADQVAGYRFDPASGNSIDPILWNGTTATRLGIGGYANGLNNLGQVVGYSYPNDVQATIWDGSTTTYLAPKSWGYDINDAGQVAAVQEVGGFNHATLWDGTTATDLGTLGGNYSTAWAINNAGQVAGESQTTDGYWHATLWDGITAVDLGTLGGNYSQANAINDVGQMVGNAQTAGGITHATLWNGTTAIDLNSFLDASTVSAGWVLQTATGINDHGWIIGRARNTLTGISSSYLLTPPVPEPEAYVMLLAGLGLVGFKSRRRRIA